MNNRALSVKSSACITEHFSGSPVLEIPISFQGFLSEFNSGGTASSGENRPPVQVQKKVYRESQTVLRFTMLT
jgi:hypothetical protein